MSKLAQRLTDALVAHIEGGKPKAPEGSAIVWNTFMSLSRARSCGPMGPNPISYPEIEAYCRLMRIPLEPRHVETITAMDRVWIERVYQKAKGVPDGVKALHPASAEALTPAMFDLVAG